MARRNRPNTTRKPPPPALAANASTADLAAQAARAQARKGSGRAGPGSRPTASPMPWWASFGTGTGSGTAAYTDKAFTSLAERRSVADTWGNYLHRRVRYDIFWSHYEGNIYQAFHRWAAALKSDRQLYAYTRTIFSPAYRIGEFWAGHLWGGPLDPDAGDGSATESALPIQLPEDAPKADALRAAIARIWQYSCWQAKKDTVTRTGAVKGDVAIVVQDDPGPDPRGNPQLGNVSLHVVDPSTIARVRRDARGNVKEYVIEEWRSDPEYDQGAFGDVQAEYSEWCRKVGDSVVYTTYRNREPYDWREYPEGTDPSEEVGAEWAEPYGFVPMVFIQHRDMGKGFGWSELQPDFGKMYETDDLASKLSDQIRKLVDNPVYIGGAAPGDVTVDMGDDVEGDGAGRESTPTLYGPEGSVPHSLLGNLDLAGASAHIKAIRDDVELDHPELATDNVGLASSGEARKVAREKVEAMVVTRRAGYDDAARRVFQMAISIGAIKGYEGFEDFDEGSYERGELDHVIGDRPVFAVDASEKLAISAQVLAIAKAAVDAQLPVEYGLELAGVSAEDIKRVLKMMDDASAKSEAKLIERQKAMMADGGVGGAADPNADPNAPDGAAPPPETIPGQVQ